MKFSVLREGQIVIKNEFQITHETPNQPSIDRSSQTKFRRIACNWILVLQQRGIAN